MKNNNIDTGFRFLLGAFILLSIYELINIVKPYYNFSWAIIGFIILSFAYYIFKNGGIEFLFSKKSMQQIKENTTKERPIGNIIFLLGNNKETIVYSAFILTFLVIISSMFIDTGSLLVYSIGLFYFLYLGAKLLGFTLDYKIIKSSVTNGNALKFFFITIGLFVVIITLIFNAFSIPDSERGLWYILLVGGYILINGASFFSWNIQFRGLFSTYNILSLFFIGGLLTFLAFQNGFLNFGKATVDEVAVQKEEGLGEPIVAEPSIISDEIEIAYESKLVSQAYLLSPGLQLGSSGDAVKPLQEVLLNLGYFSGDINGEFDENTRLALVSALRTGCNWPESTSGIFGPQAKECIDSLEISIPVEIDSALEEQEIISDEALIVDEENESGSGEILEEETGELPLSGILSPLEEEGATDEESEIIEVTPEGDTSEVVGVEEVSYESRRVSQVYTLVPDLRLGSSGEAVSDLQRVLGTLQYYIGDITGEFDAATGEALTSALRTECGWPESTRGIFGPLAKTCIDSLNITVSQ